MNITEQINAYVEEYKVFMEIEHFPKYSVRTRSVSLVAADSQGFESAGATDYDPITGKHTLTVTTNLELDKFLAFHEFTHMYDSELHTNGDKTRYLGLSGYTEYHASQVELAQLLGAKTINTVPNFSMNTVISPFAKEKSVSQYLQEKHQLAIDLFSRPDFPASVEVLKIAFGVLYNYWGLRSICEMYAYDFVETIDNAAFLQYIPAMYFVLMNKLMHGWLDKTQVDSSIPLYVNTIIPIGKRYKLF